MSVYEVGNETRCWWCESLLTAEPRAGCEEAEHLRALRAAEQATIATLRADNERRARELASRAATCITFDRALSPGELEVAQKFGAEIVRLAEKCESAERERDLARAEVEAMQIREDLDVRLVEERGKREAAEKRVAELGAALTLISEFVQSVKR